jgi:hypothetical protein
MKINRRIKYCEYGCGQIATYQLKNNKWCCSKSSNGCLKVKKRMKDSLKKIHNYYFIYKIINVLDNKFYIGIHQTNDLDDGYFGSGLLIKRSIKKHGKNNFKREIIEFCSNYEDLKSLEKKIITLDFIQENKGVCYNIQVGGSGGDNLSNHPNIKEIGEKIRKKALGRPGNRNWSHTEEAKISISEKNKHPKSEETKKNMSIAQQKRRENEKK